MIRLRLTYILNAIGVYNADKKIHVITLRLKKNICNLMGISAYFQACIGLCSLCLPSIEVQIVHGCFTRNGFLGLFPHLDGISCGTEP